MSQWAFDRAGLITMLETLRPMSGNKLNQICDNVRFTVNADDSGTSADVYLYAAQAETHICISAFTITSEQGGLETDHFLLDLKRLLKVLKASSNPEVVFIRSQDAVYEGETLTRPAQYTIKTEGLNQFKSMDVALFPDNDYAGGQLVAKYPPGVLPDLWKHAEVARGQLDIKYTCIHWDGNMCSLDGKFFVMVEPQVRFEPNSDGAIENFSVNLENNLSAIIGKMSGEIEVRRSDNSTRMTFLDNESGIYFTTQLSTPVNIPYQRILEPSDCNYERHFTISKYAFISALKRACIFIDEEADTRIVLRSGEDDLGMPAIQLQAASQNGEYDEKVAVSEITEQLASKYSAKNLLRAFENTNGDTVKVCWRVRDEPYTDRGLLITEENAGYKLYEFIPSQN